MSDKLSCLVPSSCGCYMFFLTTHRNRDSMLGWVRRVEGSSPTPSVGSFCPSVSDLASLRNVSYHGTIFACMAGDTCLCTQTNTDSDSALLCLSGGACVVCIGPDRLCLCHSYNLTIYVYLKPLCCGHSVMCNEYSWLASMRVNLPVELFKIFSFSVIIICYELLTFQCWDNCFRQFSTICSYNLSSHLKWKIVSWMCCSWIH